MRTGHTGPVMRRLQLKYFYCIGVESGEKVNDFYIITFIIRKRNFPYSKTDFILYVHSKLDILLWTELTRPWKDLALLSRDNENELSYST